MARLQFSARACSFLRVMNAIPSVSPTPFLYQAPQLPIPPIHKPTTPRTNPLMAHSLPASLARAVGQLFRVLSLLKSSLARLLPATVPVAPAAKVTITRTKLLRVTSPANQTFRITKPRATVDQISRNRIRSVLLTTTLSCAQANLSFSALTSSRIKIIQHPPIETETIPSTPTRPQLHRQPQHSPNVTSIPRTISRNAFHLLLMPTPNFATPAFVP